MLFLPCMITLFLLVIGGQRKATRRAGGKRCPTPAEGHSNQQATERATNIEGKKLEKIYAA